MCVLIVHVVDSLNHILFPYIVARILTPIYVDMQSLIHVSVNINEIDLLYEYIMSICLRVVTVFIQYIFFMFKVPHIYFGNYFN